MSTSENGALVSALRLRAQQWRDAAQDEADTYGEGTDDHDGMIGHAEQCDAAASALTSQSLSLSEARAENERLRAALAQSDLPCAYCSLPKDEWAKCASGFPGCDRADDAMGCPELGARLSIESATRQRDEALAALNASEEALKPFVTEFDERREAYIRRYPRNLGVGAANFDAMPDEWKMENSTFTMGQYRRARSVLENSKTRLADANSNPGTEQREAGR